MQTSREASPIVREWRIVGAAVALSFVLTLAEWLVGSVVDDFYDFGLFWALLTVLFASLLFGLNGFFRLFGIRETLAWVVIGAGLLLAEAALVPRPVVGNVVSFGAQTTIFVLLALIAVLPYRQDRSSPGAMAGGAILVLALFGFLQEGLIDPGFVTLQVLANYVGASLVPVSDPGALGPFTGALIPLLVLWGFLAGAIVSRNRDWGRFYADVYRPTFRALFVTSQVATILYVGYLFLAEGPRAAPLQRGDPVYLALTAVTMLLMVAFVLARARTRTAALDWLHVLRRSFVVVGTVFLIPGLYPVLDPIVRGAAVATFLYLSARRSIGKRRARAESAAADPPS